MEQPDPDPDAAEQPDASAAFTRALRGLRDAAGDPTLNGLVTAVAKQRVGVRLSPSVLSAWFNGRNIPADRTAFAALVAELEARAARRRPGYRPEPDGVWERRRAHAWAQRHANRGGRPTTFPPQAAAAAPSTRDGERSAPLPVRDTLPRDNAAFAPFFRGRVEELAILGQQLGGIPPGGGSSTTEQDQPVIVAIHGTGGVGKSTLAIRAAREAAAGFPDGRHYLDLLGSTPGRVISPLTPLAALNLLLKRINPGEPRHSDEAEASDRWKFLTAGQRLLVVLDNAFDYGQIKPLLPNSPTCAVLVTSRDKSLAERLALDGAVSLKLNALREGEAVELLAALVGHERVASHQEAARSIAKRCGGLPLAVRIAAGVLAYRDWDLAKLDAALREAPSAPVRLLSSPHGGELRVWAAFEVSYTALTKAEQRLFRFLGCLEAPQPAAWVAAALLDLPPDTAGWVLARLVNASLVEIERADPQRGAGSPRSYRLHDLLRQFAQVRLDDHDRDEREMEQWAWRQALERVTVAYHGCVNHAFNLINPDNAMVDARDLPIWARWYPNAKTAVDGGPQRDDEEDEKARRERLAKNARDWFAVEQANVLALVEQAHAATPRPAMTARLAYSLFHLLERHGYRDAWRRMDDIAMTVARETADRHAEARVLRNQGRFAMVGVLDQAGQLGGTLLDPSPPPRFPGRCATAIELLNQALTLYRQVGDRNGEAVCVRELAECRELEGEFRKAIRAYGRARKVFADLAGEDGAVGSLLIGLGRAYRGYGQHHQAQQRLEEAAAWFAEAKAAFKEGVDRGGRLPHHAVVAYGLRHLAGLYRDCYDPPRFEEALARYDQSLRAFKEARDPHGEVRTRAERGRLLARLGDYDRAGEDLRSVREQFETWQGSERASPAEEAVLTGWLSELTALTARHADG